MIPDCLTALQSDSVIPFSVPDIPEEFSSVSTLLNKGNFLVPGTADKPVGCGKSYWTSMRIDQRGAGVSYSTCKKAACPDCSFLWKLQRAFDWTVKAEIMTFNTGEHPCRVVASVPRGESYTLSNARGLRRNSNDRLSRQGMHSGLSIVHPFRLKSDVLEVVKLHTSNSSGSFWNYILSDEGIATISESLPYVKSWRDCVELSLHYHYLCFPGYEVVTGDAGLLIHKQTGGYDGEKVYELKTMDDVFKHIMYLLSHTGILIHAGDSKIKAVSGFGGLSDGAKVLDSVSSEVLTDIRDRVLAIINKDREKKLVYDENGTLRYSVPTEKDDGVIRIPIAEFMTQNPDCRDIIREWIDSGVIPENRLYVRDLVYKLWRDIDSKGVYACRQHLEDLVTPPPSFVFEGLYEGFKYADS